MSYKSNFRRDNYDSISVTLPKGAKDVLKDYCTSKGTSLNNLVSQCLLWEIGAKDWKDVINGKDNDQV